jgi:hypothetical protein
LSRQPASAARIAALQRLLAATGVGIEWEEVTAPVVADRCEENYLHTDWLESIRRNRVPLTAV